MPRFLTLFLALASLPAHAAEDPLCGNMQGIERFNPLARSPLTVIKKCIVVYCDPAVSDANAKANLKVIDTKLGDLTIATSQANMALQKFSRACKALNGKLEQVGPKMDNFRTASFELGIAKGKLSDQYTAIQTAPLEDTFSNTSSSMARDFGQPDCMNQINDLTIKELNAAQDLQNKAQVDCSPSK
jgi:hypothetical protein